MSAIAAARTDDVIHWGKADIAGFERRDLILTASTSAPARGWGVVKSLPLIGAGPVGLIHTRKVEIKYKKPLRDTWQKKDFPLRPNRAD